MKKQHFSIIGAGAIGHLWACFLQQRGFAVSLYSRTPKADQRIHVNSPLGNFSTDISYLSLSQWQPTDVILICVKAFDLQSVCNLLQPHINNTQPIILMMNGMGLVEVAHQALPNHPVFQASLVQGALLQDTQLTHTGNGTTEIGDISKASVAAPSTAITTIIDPLNQALPSVCWNPNHRQTLLLKLITNAVINPITATERITNGEVIVNQRLSKRADTLLKQLAPLMEELLPDYTYIDIERRIIDVANGTANNRSSMLRDIEMGRTTEISFINGYLVKLAKERGIDLSEHICIIDEITAQQKSG